MLRYSFVLLGLVACTPVEQPVLDGIPPAWTQVAADGSPRWQQSDHPLRDIPKLGAIHLSIAGDLYDWETVDFSTDVIDLSAEFLVEGGPMPNTLYLVGYDSGDRLLEGAGLINITATFAQAAPSTSTTATLFTAGQFAEDVVARTQSDLRVTLTELTPDPVDDIRYVAGTIAGHLCGEPPSASECHYITGSFKTDAWMPN